MGERFERHRQPWRQDEIQKLHTLAGKGMSVRAIAKALTRSEESVRDRVKAAVGSLRSISGTEASLPGRFHCPVWIDWRSRSQASRASRS